jgi:hypothetical protein
MAFYLVERLADGGAAVVRAGGRRQARRRVAAQLDIKLNGSDSVTTNLEDIAGNDVKVLLLDYMPEPEPQPLADWERELIESGQ